ncbi:FkbM family methyltransferase [Brachyspira aalborgi]|uniref:FkbM family methyltransferase n=1 Tax=Brachyspira aalborgi TaxID=29522 RepID=A0A5C8D3Z2_9SPIR|nr:FkbM family methyltransferase [Brachyspira aalborgi]TXJ20084.1 FkbM family methyltransferase [Brachyspira aalborgi]
MEFNIYKLYEEHKKEIYDIDKIIEKEGVSLFGAGQYGEFVSEYLIKNGYKINCFIDNNPNKHGTKINNIEIVSKDSDQSKNSKVLFITARHTVNEIIKQNKINYNKLIFFDKYFVIKNFNKLLDFRNGLFDDKSIKVFDVLIYSKIFGDGSYLKNVNEDNQYFCLSKFKSFNDKDIYVDVGAYVGDTIEKFIYLNSAIFSKIYAFEIGKKQFRALNTRIKRLIKEWAIDNDKITLINAGISNKNGSMFINNDSIITSNSLSSRGNYKVKVFSIDDYLKNKPITFLKADIEGEEFNMLKGAVNTIKNYKPKMAISVYHKPDDLLTIPEFIKNLVPEYKFALRHHNITFNETVLYCWIENTRRDETRHLVMFEYCFMEAA